MKRFASFLLVIICLASTQGSLKGQVCGVETGPMPSLLELLTGNYPRYGEAWLGGQLPVSQEYVPQLEIPQRNEDFREYLLMLQVPEYLGDPAERFKDILELEKQGLAERPDSQQFRYLTARVYLEMEAYSDAASRFLALLPENDSAGTNPDFCGAAYWTVMSRYLDAYDKEAPLFPNFNGGYGDYLLNALEGTGKPDVLVNGALKQIMQYMLECGADDPVLLEMAGDLMYNYGDKFQKRWFSAIAYFRAAGLTASQKAYRAFIRKAKYAMESNQINPKRFNSYRFRQLQKAFKADSAAGVKLAARIEKQEKEWLQANKNLVAEFSKAYPNPAQLPPEGFNLFPERKGSAIFALMVEEQEREMAQIQSSRNPNADPMNPDLNVGEIKSNVRYNIYAIGLILIVIGAVIFFWWQLKKNSRV